MTEVERKEDFRPEEFIDWIKDEPAGSETVSDHKSGDAYGFKDFFDTLSDTLSARAGGDDRDLIDALEEKKKKKAAEEAAKKAAAKRAESGIGDIFGADDDDERKRGIAFKSPFAEMTEEELDAALKKANKNTYWEFGLHTEKKRRAGKVESFIYEKEGTRIPVLPTYTNRMEREVCGEPVAVSFGDLPRTKNVNSVGNPNAIRYTTHLEIHFDITEGAETKEGKSAAYMKAQSFLAAAYRGDTLGGKPVRKFRLTNMSEEELKAWGEVRAAFEGQGKKIEFILTDEQQKVFDRYAAKFAEITRLNRELVGAEKVTEMTAEKDTEKTTSESMVEPTESKTEGTSETSKDVVSEEEKTPAESKTVVEPTEVIDAPVPEAEETPVEDKPIIDVEMAKTTDSEDAAEADSEPTVELAERKSAEVDVPVTAEEISKMYTELRNLKEMLEALRRGAIPVGPVTEDAEATVVAEDSPRDSGEFVNLPDYLKEFFKNMDEVEATAAKESVVREFFKNMDEIAAAVMKENAGNSGVSQEVKEKVAREIKAFDLSTEKGKIDARKATTAIIVSDLSRAFNHALERNNTLISNEILTTDEIKKDLDKYYNLYGEKAEEIIANSEDSRTARDILKETKLKVGESRFANERAKKAYEKDKFNREMAIKTEGGYWHQNER